MVQSSLKRIAPRSVIRGFENVHELLEVGVVSAELLVRLAKLIMRDRRCVRMSGILCLFYTIMMEQQNMLRGHMYFIMLLLVICHYVIIVKHLSCYEIVM